LTTKLEYGKTYNDKISRLKKGGVKMTELSKVLEKVTSYNLFNNLFPGIIFSCIVEKVTRFSIAEGNLLQNLFIYYFVGMVLSRIGSIFIEKILKSIKTADKKEWIHFESYGDYVQAVKVDSFILTLNETNNTYRTIIAMVLSLIAVKTFDWVIYDKLSTFSFNVDNWIFLILCSLLLLLFAMSYKKQTDYISKRIENAIKNETKGGI